MALNFHSTNVYCSAGKSVGFCIAGIKESVISLTCNRGSIHVKEVHVRNFICSSCYIRFHFWSVLNEAVCLVPGLEQRRRVYPLCIGCTAVQSIVAALPLGPLSALANALPLAALGFGWVLPAAAGLLAGILLSRTEE